MAHHWADNVITTAFTPRDYQVELLATAREGNIIVCLGQESSKEFIALKLLQELAFQVRNESDGRKHSLYITKDGESIYNLIHYLTDLCVVNMNALENNKAEKELIEGKQVIILDGSICKDALELGTFDFNSINLIIIDNCHCTEAIENLSVIFENYYKECQQRPKILGLAGPLYSAKCELDYLPQQLDYMERILNSKIETASDVVTVLRYSTSPSEYIVECSPPSFNAVTETLQEMVLTRRAFLDEHRYDPSEIYSDEFSEELKGIPDPKLEPLDFLNNFLEILNEMGPWCADRAALHLLMQIEKQKVKTPYERHFLLLCMVSTAFVQIRAYCDWAFQGVPNEMERLRKYSSPKVLRLLEILRIFKPEEKRNSKWKEHREITSSVSDKVLNDIDSLDFKNLQINVANIIEKIPEMQSDKSDTIQLLEGLEKVLQNNEIPSSSEEKKIPETKSIEKKETRPKYGGNRPRHRRKYHPNPGARHRHNHSSNDPDALCGLIFCHHKNTARVLFSLLQEVSNHDPDLSFLNVQYTVDRAADPITEAKEAEQEHRKQEEVLKRFRMHECNILIGTAILEEGIDLPKCNLVLRWDTPATYRSYVQCKGRARAPQSYHVILVAPNLPNINVQDDRMSENSHRMLCQSELNEKQDEKLEEIVKPAIVEPSRKLNGYKQQIEEPKIEKLDNLLHELENSKSSPAHYDELEDEQKLEDFKCCLAVEDLQKSKQTQTDGLTIQTSSDVTNSMVKRLAEYFVIELVLLNNCANTEPSIKEQRQADKFNHCIAPYKTLNNSPDVGGSVCLETAVALVNKYCAKLPSDTFTKLTPIWRCAKTQRNGHELYQYTVRLPINSPLKHDIRGLPMPNKILARRMAALIVCKELHKSGELDNTLQPIGKEGFKAAESDWEIFELEENDEKIVTGNFEPRPGTTKRRQYYYKRIASAFNVCRPTAGVQCYLYHIKLTLECPIPEEQNTRGRRIYPPEDALQGFGILTTKKIPKVSAFPIFTRSGEVRVSLELISTSVILENDQIEKIKTFLNYTFTNVLRLQKFLMLFDAEAAENSFFIVPTVRKADDTLIVDWEFLEVIANNSENMPKPVPEKDRNNQEFDGNRFKDAVVMPWYRNQDHPQYFYVAEICSQLSPESSFPGENYTTFQEYYSRKYNITIQNTKQPLLDVDHTSARLNFLTPRYVNRKGVALPTSSEETKKAKRENLEHKQILVPELCTIHPFPASLWRAAVCLPCILYRINALLLADEIRKQVSFDLALGRMEIEDPEFEWPTLDFGWSLAEVLKKSREAKNVNDSTEVEDKKNTEKLETFLKNGIKDSRKMNGGIGDIDEKTANDLLEEVDEKLKNNCLLEIGMWSNEMAENIPINSDDTSDDWGLLPPNVNMCSRNNTNIRYGSPTSWDVRGTASVNKDMDNYYDDSDVSYQSDDDFDVMSTESNEIDTGPLKIEYRSYNTAEAIETEEEARKREKQQAILNESNAKDKNYQLTKNNVYGYEFSNIPIIEEEKDIDLRKEIESWEKRIRTDGMLVKENEKLKLKKEAHILNDDLKEDFTTICTIFPYTDVEFLKEFLILKGYDVNCRSLTITLDHCYELNEKYLTGNSEKYTIVGTGDIFDNFNDQNCLKIENESKIININFNIDTLNKAQIETDCSLNNKHEPNVTTNFSFDKQPNLNGHPGPSPSIILQALTMSNANDGINLERLETIGDSFLKYAITTYLYITYENVHEGKLSHLRSKQVSNLNLYRLGRRKVFGECMIATKFEPHDNWLPPCYYVPKELEKALIEARIPVCHWNLADLPNIKSLSSEEICQLVKQKAETLGLMDEEDFDEILPSQISETEATEDFPCFIPYNLVTQHSIPDKSVADCVEALIGAYLIECGPRGALLFMAWLGIRVLPTEMIEHDQKKARVPGSTQPDAKNSIVVYGEWAAPKSPLLTFAPNYRETLELLLDGFSAFEDAIAYKFSDRSYLLQAMTHASYSPNRLTDCYQRLEFLGDAVLDYLITRHLYEDPRQHSPGALTDLRSALVNNTIFASLAVRHGFHKYFRHLSPGLNEVIERFVRIQHENGHSISEEYYLLSEEECDEAEDVEVPKALGDVFESVAGAIFLDSNMSLDTVWKVYSTMMRPEIEQFSSSVPKSPIRELLELEPETAKFSKPEKLADGRRVRVTVEVFGKGTFRGIGRNYRIAKCTAAKCALRQLKKQGLITKRH